MANRGGASRGGRQPNARGGRHTHFPVSAVRGSAARTVNISIAMVPLMDQDTGVPTIGLAMYVADAPANIDFNFHLVEGRQGDSIVTQLLPTSQCTNNINQFREMVPRLTAQGLEMVNPSNWPPPPPPAYFRPTLASQTVGPPVVAPQSASFTGMPPPAPVVRQPRPAGPAGSTSGLAPAAPAPAAFFPRAGGPARGPSGSTVNTQSPPPPYQRYAPNPRVPSAPLNPAAGQAVPSGRPFGPGAAPAPAAGPSPGIPAVRPPTFFARPPAGPASGLAAGTPTAVPPVTAHSGAPSGPAAGSLAGSLAGSPAGPPSGPSAGAPAPIYNPPMGSSPARREQNLSVERAFSFDLQQAHMAVERPHMSAERPLATSAAGSATRSAAGSAARSPSGPSTGVPEPTYNPPMGPSPVWNEPTPAERAGGLALLDARIAAAIASPRRRRSDIVMKLSDSEDEDETDENDKDNDEEDDDNDE